MVSRADFLAQVAQHRSAFQAALRPQATAGLVLGPPTASPGLGYSYAALLADAATRLALQDALLATRDFAALDHLQNPFPRGTSFQDISGVVNDIEDSRTPGASATPGLSRAEHPTGPEDISGRLAEAAPQQSPISELSQHGGEKQSSWSAKAVQRLPPTATPSGLQATGASARPVNTVTKVAPPSARQAAPQSTRCLSVESPRQRFGDQPAPKASVRAEPKKADTVSRMQGALEEATKQLHVSQEQAERLQFQYEEQRFQYEEQRACRAALEHELAGLRGEAGSKERLCEQQRLSLKEQQQTLRGLQDRLQRREEEDRAGSESLQDCASACKRLTAENERCRAKLLGCQGRLAEKERDADKTAAQIRVLEEAVQKAESKASKLESSKSPAKDVGEVLAQQESNAHLQQRSKALKKALDSNEAELRRAVRRTRETEDASQQSNALLLHKLEDTLTGLERLQAHVGELKGKLRSTQAEADLAQSQNQAAGQLVSKSKAERNAARKEAATLGQRLLEQGRALDQLRQEHQSCDSKAQQLQERLHQAKTKLQRAISEAKHCRDQILKTVEDKVVLEASSEAAAASRIEFVHKLQQKCARLAAELDVERCQTRELRARAEEAEWKHRQAVSREAAVARVDSALAQPGAVKAGQAYMKPPFRLGSPPARGALGRGAAAEVRSADRVGRAEAATQVSPEDLDLDAEQPTKERVSEQSAVKYASKFRT